MDRKKYFALSLHSFIKYCFYYSKNKIHILVLPCNILSLCRSFIIKVCCLLFLLYNLCCTDQLEVILLMLQCKTIVTVLHLYTLCAKWPNSTGLPRWEPTEDFTCTCNCMCTYAWCWLFCFTAVDFVIPTKGESLLEAYERWKKWADEKGTDLCQFIYLFRHRHNGRFFIFYVYQRHTWLIIHVQSCMFLLKLLPAKYQQALLGALPNSCLGYLPLIFTALSPPNFWTAGALGGRGGGSEGFYLISGIAKFDVDCSLLWLCLPHGCHVVVWRGWRGDGNMR